jgi:hypothetical protein
MDKYTQLVCELYYIFKGDNIVHSHIVLQRCSTYEEFFKRCCEAFYAKENYGEPFPTIVMNILMGVPVREPYFEADYNLFKIICNESLASHFAPYSLQYNKTLALYSKLNQFF